MQLDFILFQVINDVAGRSHKLDLLFILIAKYGLVLYVLALILLWFKKGNHDEIMKNRELAIRTLVITFLALGINQIIGLIYFRPRPFATHKVTLLLDRSPDPSFPSDHATGSAAVTTALWGYNPVFSFVLAIFTALLMFSRIYVGTHYPLDILGGLCTGILANIIVDRLWIYLNKPVKKILKIYESLVQALKDIRGNHPIDRSGLNQASKNR